MSQDTTQDKGHAEIPNHIVPGVVALDIDVANSDDRFAVLNAAAERAGGRLVTRNELADFLQDDDLAERVSRLADFVHVAGDPEEAAEAAMEIDERVIASPVHRLGFHWHRLYAAIEPEPAPDFALPHPSAGEPGRVIAVVDSGLSDPASLPGWMQSSVILGESDVEPPTEKGGASHGTFVTSLLRQIAPTHVVSMTRVATFEDPTGDDDHPEPYPTTEFHVAGAIDRVIERHKGGGGVEALHLAVGGPAAKKRPPVTLQRAIDAFREEFPGAAIFSAAGNSDQDDTIYPAAFDYVRGVAAANHDGDQIVWDAAGDEIPNPPPRHWVDDVAPGSRLVGLSGQEDPSLISWSGSSFATSVAVASHVSHGPVEVRAGTAYWPNRIMRYGDVPGLRFEGA